MFPRLSAIDLDDSMQSPVGNNMLEGLPGYLMASFYPQMEAEVAVCDAADGSAAAAAVETTPMDRALVASKNHREAERRRRERIKSHLDRLRTILACDPKTDKASLLAKTVERVRDLKQQTAEISQMQLFPSETDEIVVLPSGGGGSGQRLVFQASLCCEDRSDLLPELIETLRSLRLTTLRAEISTLGGRVRNVLILARENDQECDHEEFIGGGFLRDALKALVDRQVSGEHYCKRRRLVDRSLT